MNILGKQSEVVPMVESVTEQLPGVLDTTQMPQCVNQPEATNKKSRLRQAKVILCRVPHNVLSPHKFLLQGCDGRDEARIGCIDQAKLGEQQDARVEVIAADGCGEGAAFTIPRAVEDGRTDGLG